VVAAALPLATGPRAAKTAALLHSLQSCCTAGSQRGMVQKNQTMLKRETDDRISPKTDNLNSPCLFELADYNKIQ
jgi:hypothetical protein